MSDMVTENLTPAGSWHPSDGEIFRALRHSINNQEQSSASWIFCPKAS